MILNPTTKELKNPEEVIPNLDLSFEMTFDYKRKHEETIISLKGQKLLTNGNFLLLVARAGSGKSNTIEALAANAINPDCDAFGLEVSIGTGSVLVIDTEQAYNDINDGFKRILNRARIFNNEKEVDSKRIKRCHIHSYKMIENIEDFVKTLWYHAGKGYKLIMIDQIADFLLNPNDAEKSKLLTREVEKICTVYDCGIILTIHPNPLDPSHKATGHLGSYLQKKSMSCLAVMKADDETRVITSNFGHGKLRKATPVETSFMWDESSQMFIGCEITSKTKSKINKDNIGMDAIIELLFSVMKRVTKDELFEFVKKKKKDVTWEYIENYISERNTIVADFDGNYILNNEEKFDCPF